MKVLSLPAELRSSLKGAGSIGLVPTMGFLHAGHASLLRRARQQHDTVVLSIFVNPSQFGPNEDFSGYPRDLERDLEIARAEGVDHVFTPSAAALYPQGFSTSVQVAGLSETLEGAARPGHFSGVATVVCKFFNLVQPDCAYFGEKDWQQLAVVRRMALDLNLPLEVVGCPTVREAGGLALSSRNSYLTPPLRARAGVLYHALEAARACYAAGERGAEHILQAGRAVLEGDVDFHLEYFTLVDDNLTMLTGAAHLHDSARLLLAARTLGAHGQVVRLLDNAPLVGPSGDVRDGPRAEDGIHT